MQGADASPRLTSTAPLLSIGNMSAGEVSLFPPPPSPGYSSALILSLEGGWDLTDLVARTGNDPAFKEVALRDQESGSRTVFLRHDGAEVLTLQPVRWDDDPNNNRIKIFYALSVEWSLAAAYIWLGIMGAFAICAASLARRAPWAPSALLALTSFLGMWILACDLQLWARTPILAIGWSRTMLQIPARGALFELPTLMVLMILIGASYLCLRQLPLRIQTAGLVVSAALARFYPNLVVQLILSYPILRGLIVSGEGFAALKRGHGLEQSTLASKDPGPSLVSRQGFRAALLGATLLAIIGLGVSRWTFEKPLGGRPALGISKVSLAYARALSQGELLASPQYLVGRVASDHYIFTAKGWYPTLPPVHLLVLAAAQKLGSPEWANPILGAATTLVVFALGTVLSGAWAGFAGALMWALSPLQLGMSAEALSHATAALLGALLLLSVVRLRGRSSSPWALFIPGLLVGLLIATRPYTGVLLAVGTLPLLRWLEVKIVRAGVMTAFLGVLIGVSPLLIFNGLTSGYIFLPGYIAKHGLAHLPIIGSGVWGESWSAERAALGLLNNIKLVIQLEAGFPMPWLLLGVMAAAVWLPSVAWSFTAPFLALLLGHALFWHYDAYFGPRFVYEGFPALAVLFGIVVAEARRGIPARPTRLLLGVALVASSLVAILNTMPRYGELFVASAGECRQ